MLQFHSCRSHWRPAYIFRYNPSLREIVGMFVNKGKRKKQINHCNMKSLQWNHCNEIITKRRHFFHFQLLPKRILREFKKFSFSFISFIHIRAIITICFFQSALGILSSVIALPSYPRSVLRPRELSTDRKNSYCISEKICSG